MYNALSVVRATEVIKCPFKGREVLGNSDEQLQHLI